MIIRHFYVSDIFTNDESIKIARKEFKRSGLFRMCIETINDTQRGCHSFIFCDYQGMQEIEAHKKYVIEWWKND